MTSTQRVADLMAATLFQAGIRHGFGMPGGEVTTLIDALVKAGIDFVLARNETAAAMMAAGTCVEARHPGLLVTTIGPGLANGINGIADAAQERIPLIVISGTIEERLRGRYTHQVVDHRQLLAAVVKATFEATRETASAVVARAIRLAMTHPCGPVHIDLSPSVAAAVSAEKGFSPVVALRTTSPDPQDPSLRELGSRLAAAKRPIILAGLDAARDEHASSFTSLVERFGIPVLTTYKAKGLIDENHPLSLGAAGLSPRADDQILPLLRQSDLLLMLGYDPIEMRAGWLDPIDEPSRIIELGRPQDHGMHLAGLRIEASPVTALMSALSHYQPQPVWTGGEAAQLRETLRSSFVGPAHWGPHRVFEALQNKLPKDALLSVDSGAHRILLSQRWSCAQPFGLIQSAGWCTMGSALPLAIAQKLTHPDRQVVAVLGDGGLEMTLGELGTLRDQNLAVVVLVLQDQSLELIGLKQDQGGLERRGVSLGATDYAGVAEAFGGRGVKVTSQAELEAALAAAQIADRFTVISCDIPANAYASWI